MKKILGCIRKAVKDFDMIEDGARVAVGISGGKDSMTLLYAMKLFQRFSPVKFELEALTIALGFENFDLGLAEDFCKKIDVPYTIQETQISKIVFEAREEKNPCSLCANMRRGALHNVMKERGLTTLALGHHSDDAIETLFLNIFYAGSINTFSPKSYMSRKKIHVVRPMIYISEGEIMGAVKRHNIPVIKSPCPMDKITKREEMKNRLKDIYKEIPGSKDRVMTALKNKDQISLWF